MGINCRPGLYWDVFTLWLSSAKVVSCPYHASSFLSSTALFSILILLIKTRTYITNFSIFDLFRSARSSALRGLRSWGIRQHKGILFSFVCFEYSWFSFTTRPHRVFYETIFLFSFDIVFTPLFVFPRFRNQTVHHIFMINFRGDDICLILIQITQINFLSLLLKVLLNSPPFGCSACTPPWRHENSTIVTHKAFEKLD